MIALVTAVAAFGEFVGTAFAASGPVATFPSAKQPSKAVLFNGTSSMVTVRHTADLKLTHAMTLEARVMPSSRLSGRRDIIVKTRSRGPFPYGLELTNGVPDAYATIDGQVLTVSASSALALHKWSFVAAYYNGQSFQLYVNHRLVASRSARGDLSTAKGPVEIGGDSRWGRHYHGTIDEVRIYSRSLSSTHGKDRRAQPPGTATPTTTKPARVTPATAAPTSSSPPPAAPVLSASANLWVSSLGGSCARQSTKGAEVASGDCASIQAAYDKASCGDTINIDSGNYGSVTLQEDTSDPATVGPAASASDKQPTPTCASPVIFEPGPGATQASVTFSDINGGYDNEVGSSNWLIQDVSIQYMTLFPPANNDTENDIKGGDAYLNGVTDYTLENSNMGACYGGVPASYDPAITCSENFKVDPAWPGTTTGPYFTSGITFNHDYFHDFIDNYAGVSTHSGHDECIFLNGGANETVENSKFSVCQLYAIFLQDYSQVPFTNLTIQNNWFSGTENGPTICNPMSSGECTGPTADEYGTPRDTAICSCANAVAGSTGEAAAPPVSNMLLRYNSFMNDEGWIENSTAGDGTNNRIIGNIESSPDSSCVNDPGNITYDYNVYLNGPACASDPHGTSYTAQPYINNTETPSGEDDMHLTCGTGLENLETGTTPDDTLTTDLDGNTRPTNGPRTPGAQQTTC
jgi:hypothetical protein